MAKFIVCSVYDSAVKAYMMPFHARSKDEARRSFGDAVLDPKMEFGKHPLDYSLVALAEWDDNGTYTVYDHPDRLMDAKDVVPHGTIGIPGVTSNLDDPVKVVRNGR